MNPLAIVDFVLSAVFLLVAMVAFGYVWIDIRRERAEAELDRQQEEILRLAVNLTSALRDQGLDARRALIRAAQQASGRSSEKQ